MASNQLLASKIVFQEVPPAGRAVPAFNTCVVAFEGITEKGPINTPTLVMGFSDFKRTFGGYIANSDLAACVEGFFATGGVICYVNRVVHYTDITDATTATSDRASADLSASIVATAASNTSGNAGPYALSNGQTLVVVIDSNSSVTGTVSATAAALTTDNSGTIVLADAETLTVAIDTDVVKSSTIVFHSNNFVDIGAATQAEIAAVIASQITGASVDLNGGKVRITSDHKGTASAVHVTGGTANATLGFSTTLVAGTGNVANVAAVTATEVAAIVSTAVGSTATVSVTASKVKIASKITGTGSHVQVTGASTATAVGFDNATHSGVTGATVNTVLVEGKYDGTYANDLSVVKGVATSGAAGRFNLYVVDSAGLRKESFPNLSMDPGSSQYLETVINSDQTGSAYIRVTDLGATTDYVSAVPSDGTTRLTGGSDGLVSIDNTDYLGNSASWTGLYAFDKVSSLTVLAVPGIATPAVHLGMVAYCETHRGGQLFPILDPPAGLTAAQMITYVTTTAALENLSEFGAIYWPRIKVANPSTAVYGVGDTVVIPPSGDICGVIARTDNARDGGVWDQPAGTETGKFARVLGFESDDVLSEDVRDLLFPNRINPLTTQEGFPRYIDGARTLKGDGNFPSLGQRRGISYCERTIKAALEPIRHKNNNQDTRAVVQRTVFGFLKNQMDLGAFATKVPATSFYVDFGDALQVSPNIIDGEWGVATTQPAEFIRMKVSQDMRAADASR